MSARGFYRLVAATTIATYLLIIVGGIVSATGSGMGCGPEWPLCHGEVIPYFSSPEVAIEYFHRIFAGVIGLLILGTLVVAWRLQDADLHLPSIRRTAVVGLVLFIVQSLLGAVTVWLDLPVSVTTLHLGASMALLAVLIYLTAAASPVGGLAPDGDRSDGGDRVRARLAAPAWLASGAVFVVVMIGAYVKKTNAGLACLDVPLCDDQLLPTAVSGPVFAQYVHRMAAFAAGLIVLWLLYRAWRERGRAPHVFRSALVAACLVVLQILLGIWTVASAIPPAVTVAHLANAAALLGTLIWTASSLTPAAAARSRGSGVAV